VEIRFFGAVVRTEGDPSQSKTVVPGETISEESGFMRGHGTYTDPANPSVLLSSICGTVEHVNKLVSVRPLRCRYQPEVGDVVVGRITEVGSKRWKVDINGRLDAVLQLSAINLPGGEVRRRNTSDELQMRHFFVEHDLISAEVQQFFQDGSVAIHTRSLKYGKLTQGQLVVVPSSLVKRCKNHFVELSIGVHVILGTNGYIWISKPVSTSSDRTITGEEEKKEGGEKEEASTTEGDGEGVTVATREKIARVRNCIVALWQCGVRIHPGSILDTYEASFHLAHWEILTEMQTVTLPARQNMEQEG